MPARSPCDAQAAPLSRSRRTSGAPRAGSRPPRGLEPGRSPPAPGGFTPSAPGRAPSAPGMTPGAPGMAPPGAPGMGRPAPGMAPSAPGGFTPSAPGRAPSAPGMAPSAPGMTQVVEAEQVYPNNDPNGRFNDPNRREKSAVGTYFENFSSLFGAKLEKVTGGRVSIPSPAPMAKVTRHA